MSFDNLLDTTGDVIDTDSTSNDDFNGEPFNYNKEDEGDTDMEVELRRNLAD